MKITDSIFERYGESLYAGGRYVRGFISPVSTAGTKSGTVHLGAGKLDEAEYRLLTAVPVTEGMSIAYRGESYEAIRSERVCVFGSVSHYESVLRKVRV